MIDHLPGHAFLVGGLIFLGAMALLISDVTTLFIG